MGQIFFAKFAGGGRDPGMLGMQETLCRINICTPKAREP